jgi:hypothetical protein
MTKQLQALLAVSATILTLSACSPERTALDAPPGNYEKTVSTTDANGTTTRTQSSTDVSVDKKGNKTAVVKSKTTKDPKGMMNKTTTSESEQVIEEK